MSRTAQTRQTASANVFPLADRGYFTAVELPFVIPSAHDSRSLDVPMPYARNLERAKTPSKEKIVEAIRRVCYVRGS